MSFFDIDGRRVGPDEVPLVVAEVGINHEGSIDVAIDMANAAIQAGAEVIKHQTHIPSEEMSMEARTVIPGNAEVSIYEIIERCALNEDEENKLRDYVKSKGAIFISTPFSLAAVDRIGRMQLPAVKIGSGECANLPIVRAAASLGRPLIISTGMQTLESIKPTVGEVRRAGVPYALLHCTNLYPTPPELVRLGGISALQEAFPDAVVGYSDHSESLYPAIGAMALGACIVERHFTDTFSRPGPDISSSMDPDGLRTLLASAKVLSRARGGKKEPADAEKVTMAFAFSSVVTKRPIEAGELFTEENLTVKRPSGGAYGPADLELLFGQRAAIHISADRQLPADAVQWTE